MSDSHEVIWNGHSGARYKMWAYPLGKRFKDGVEGVYIFTRLTGRAYEAVYIGQGNLNDRFNSHESEGCLTRKGATEIHCCSIKSQARRREVEQDLLAVHLEAYEPTGCNEKIGG